VNLTRDRIGPTAHYTGYVWARHGLSHPDLATTEGRVLFDALQPAMLLSSAIGGPVLEAYLLARHRAIDALLERAIEDGAVSQVIEVAAGLSPRGWRFANRYGERLRYIEADLPEMAARKRGALERIGSLSDHHQVRALDALKDEGPESLAAATAELDDQRGLAIITEGLLGYLPTHAVNGIWRRFARALKGFPTGRYISDLHLGGAVTPPVQGFRLLLSAFVRGRVYLHFEDAAEAEAALRAAGFAAARVQPAEDVIGAGEGRGSRLANILEASIT
jgi:O-methyltransferase involved in polyketide biosynthesis